MWPRSRRTCATPPRCWPTRSCGPSSTRPNRYASSSAVLHFLDVGSARQVSAGYVRLIAPGSCLVISCAAYDDEALAKRLAAEYTAGQFINHTREDVVSFFAGLELVGPGVTEAQTWRPWMPQPVVRQREGHVLVGVARRQA